MNYLAKTIESPCGADAVAWKGILFTANLENQTGLVTLRGYVSPEAMAGSELPVDNAGCAVSEFDEMNAYGAFFTEVLTHVVGDPTSKWYGASVDPCPIHVDGHGRVLNMSTPIKCENGVMASCWRCVGLEANIMKGVARFFFAGWTNQDNFCAGKGRASGDPKRWVTRMNIADLVTYPALYLELVGKVCQTESSKLYGATLANYEPEVDEEAP